MDEDAQQRRAAAALIPTRPEASATGCVSLASAPPSCSPLAPARQSLPRGSRAAWTAPRSPPPPGPLAHFPRFPTNLGRVRVERARGLDSRRRHIPSSGRSCCAHKRFALLGAESARLSPGSPASPSARPGGACALGGSALLGHRGARAGRRAALRDVPRREERSSPVRPSVSHCIAEPAPWSLRPDCR